MKARATPILLFLVLAGCSGGKLDTKDSDTQQDVRLVWPDTIRVQDLAHAELIPDGSDDWPDAPPTDLEDVQGPDLPDAPETDLEDVHEPDLNGPDLNGPDLNGPDLADVIGNDLPDLPDTTGPEIQDVPPVDLCIPQCAGKTCGPDGCGGDCGSCPADLTCSAEGTCQQKPEPCMEPGMDPGGALESYFVHPLVGACGVDDVVLGDEGPQPHTLGIVLWRLGKEADDAAVTWNLGAKTGFIPAPGNEVGSYQRGPQDAVEVPAVQVRGDEIGFWFQSEKWPHEGEIIPTVAHYDWTVQDDIRPWQIPGSELGYSFELQVPTASVSGTGAVYVTPVFAFRNVLSGKSFWWVSQAFDLRPPNAEGVIYDSCSTCTGLPIVVTTIADGMKFLRRAEGSTGFTQGTWTGYQWYGLRISRGKFTRALHALVAKTGPAAGYTTSPGDYQLIHFNFNPEVYAPQGQGQGQLGLSVRRLHIARYQAPVVSQLTVHAANAGPSTSMQVFFKTLESDFYSEDKSVWVPFSGGGGWIDVVVDLAKNAAYRGIITGIRIDPFDANEAFGIDDVCLGTGPGSCVLHWSFDGADAVKSPFFGWTLSGVGETWTDGSKWGGKGTDGDPYLHTDIDLDCGL